MVSSPPVTPVTWERAVGGLVGSWGICVRNMKPGVGPLHFNTCCQGLAGGAPGFPCSVTASLGCKEAQARGGSASCDLGEPLLSPRQVHSPHPLHSSPVPQNLSPGFCPTVVLGVELRALHLPGKHAAAELLVGHLEPSSGWFGRAHSGPYFPTTLLPLSNLLVMTPVPPRSFP